MVDRLRHGEVAPISSRREKENFRLNSVEQILGGFMQRGIRGHEIWRTVSWMLRCLRAVPRGFAVLCVAAGAIASLIPAAGVKAIQMLAGWAGSANATVQALVIVALVFGLSSVIQQASFAFGRRLANRIDAHAAALLNERLARSSPVEFLDHECMREVISARQCVSEGKVSTALQGLLNVLNALITAATLVGSLWSLSPVGSMVSMCAAFPILATYGWYGRQESRLWPIAAGLSRRAAYFDEQLAHPRSAIELLAAGVSKQFADSSAESRLKAIGVRDRLEKLSIVSDSIAGSGSSLLLFIALVLFWCGGGGHPVDMAAGIVGIVSGMSSMAGLGHQVGELASSVPAVTRYRRLVETHDIRQGWGQFEFEGRVTSLVATALCVTYPGVPGDIVRDVNLVVSRGHVTALVGGNGAGKTTLVRGLSGIVPWSGGDVVVNLDDGRSQSPTAAMVASLGQDFGRYEVTVREYLELGSRDSLKDSDLWGSLARVGLDSTIRGLPDGLDTQLGSSWEGTDLSGGQWQKLALARLFLLDRPIWILDEPTSAIDAETEGEIFDLLQAECQDRCVLVVTHRASTLTHVDDILVMDKGLIVQRGSFNDLMRCPGRFREMFQGQLEEVRKMVGISPD